MVGEGRLDVFDGTTNQIRHDGLGREDLLMLDIYLIVDVDVKCNDALLTMARISLKLRESDDEGRLGPYLMTNNL